MSEKKWEELKTPESVLAAFAAGRAVEYKYRDTPWVQIHARHWNVAAADMFQSGRYRALIEETAIPAGYTPRIAFRDGCYRVESEQAPAIHGTCSSHCAATGECTNSCAPINAQPSQQGEAVAYCDPDDPINSTAFAWPGSDRDKSRHTHPLYMHPAEPLGRDAEGLAAFGYESIVDNPPPRRKAIVYWHRDDDGPGYPAVTYDWRDEHRSPHAVAWHPEASGVARRLRPQVDDAGIERMALQMLFDRFPDRPRDELREMFERNDQTRDHWMRRARAALTAALTEADSHGK